MGKYDELVEGLRELHEKFVGQAGRNYTAALFGEVATAIATLEAELAEAQQQVKGALIMHEALSEKLEITQDELAAMKARGDCGWLIEHPGAPMWLTLTNPCRDWTADSNEAVRFSRQRDAEAYIRDIGITGARATEHRWD